MAFGLKHVGKPDDNRTEPIEYMIDYIRLYQNEDGKMFKLNENKDLEILTDPYSQSEFKK